MSDRSKIAWTQATWNPVVGCSKASPGCANCYAETMAARLASMGQEKYAAVVADRRWNGRTHLDEAALDQPRHWRKPRRVFVCSMGDLFHESVPFKWIDRVFKVMQTQSRHTYQVLTKRPERMRQFLSERVSVPWGGFTFGEDCGRNIWLGTTCEDQDRADERIPHLLATPAVRRFVSVEPMLGAIKLPGLEKRAESFTVFDSKQAKATGAGGMLTWAPRLDWVIIGAESGPKARHCSLPSVRSLVEQCKSAGVACFVKQLHLDGRLSKDIAEWPAWARVQERADA